MFAGRSLWNKDLIYLFLKKYNPTGDQSTVKSAASPFPLSSNSKARLLPAADKRIINNEERPLLEDNLSRTFKGSGTDLREQKVSGKDFSVDDGHSADDETGWGMCLGIPGQNPQAHKMELRDKINDLTKPFQNADHF